MWGGCSPASWRMYSPRSVSTAWMPCASRASLMAISSRRHRLRLGYELGSPGQADLDDRRSRLLVGCASPDVSAPSLDVRLELVEIARKVVNHARPGAAALFAETLDVVDLGPGIDADLPQQSGGRVEGLLKVGISEISAGSVPESSSWSVQPTHDPRLGRARLRCAQLAASS